MITGVRQEDADGNPFGWDADTYFASAYSTSPFLQELKANGYEIRLYTGPYYGYRSAEPLAGIAENVEVSDGYRISNRVELVQYMIGLAGYRLLPHLLKNTIHVTTAMFNSLVQYVGEHPAYVLNDWETFAGLTEHGLTVDAQGRGECFPIHSSQRLPRSLPHGRGRQLPTVCLHRGSHQGELQPDLPLYCGAEAAGAV